MFCVAWDLIEFKTQVFAILFKIIKPQNSSGFISINKTSSDSLKCQTPQENWVCGFMVPMLCIQCIIKRMYALYDLYAMY